MKKILILSGLSSTLLFACNNNQGKNAGSQPAPSSMGPDAQALFRAKCAVCHEVKTDKIGPALSGSLARWGNDTSRLKEFISNSAKVIKSGDEYAYTLFQKWHQSEMPSFPDLSDEEIKALIEYIQ